MSTRSTLALIVALGAFSGLGGVQVTLPCAVAEDAVFSGPQAGETLVPFEAMRVYDDQAGKNFDPVAEAAARPTLLVFVHNLTRPGMALTRALTTYANNLSEAGTDADRSAAETAGKGSLYTAVIWLEDDKAKAEQFLNRARKSLDFVVPIGVSVDGGEGPGSYGLNRNVELTILIAQEEKVVANYALVQPSVSEAAKIAGELAKLVGKTPPKNEELERLAYPNGMMMRRPGMQRQRSQENR